jgi:hypothetical protein
MAAIDDISNLYVGYFNRAPDPAGLNFWVTQYTALGQTPAALAGIAQSFAQVPEATNLYGFLSAPLVGSPTSFLASLYLNLFNRVIDTAGSAFWVGQLALPGAAVGRIIQNIISGAQGDDALVVANKSLIAKTFAQNLLDNNAVFSSALAASALTGVTKDAATATAKIATNLTAIQGSAGSAGGQTFVLTAATDNLVGTGSNDTFIGDFATTAQGSDQINAGGGIDILRLFGAFDAAKLPVSATGLDTLEIVVSGNNSINSTVIAGLTKLQINDGVALNTQTLTTGAGTALQLASSAANANANTWAASATDTTATLNLAGFNGTGGTLTVTGAATTSLIVNSTVSANTIGTLNGPATATGITLNSTSALVLNSVVSANVATVNVTGAGNTTLVGTDLAATLAVNAATATGKVSFTATEASTLTFTGGSGNDTLLFTATNLTTADKGSGGAGTDTLGINDTAPVYAAINALTDFEVLGLFTTGATVDKSLLTTINSFFVNTGSQTFTNTTNASTFTLNNVAGLGTVAIGAATGQTAVGITIDNGTATAAQTITALTLTGLTGVTLVSNGTGVGGSNIITTFTNVENSNITLTGARDLTITNPLAGATTGSVFDANAFTGKLTVTGSGFNDIITGGSAVDTLVGGAGNDTIGGGAGNDLITGGLGVDTQTGGAGDDKFIINLATESNGTAVDRVTDFTGNGAAAGDGFQFGTGAASFGTGITFTGATTTTVTVASVGTAATLADIAAAITGIAASTSGAAQIVDVTVSAGAAAGRYLILNDEVAAITLAAATDDTIVNITGVTGALNAQDFTYV